MLSKIYSNKINVIANINVIDNIKRRLQHLSHFLFSCSVLSWKRLPINCPYVCVAEIYIYTKHIKERKKSFFFFFKLKAFDITMSTYVKTFNKFFIPTKI